MSETSSLQVKCPHCGTEWELDEEERQLSHFTCGTCSTSFSIEYAHELSNNAEESALPPVHLSQLVIVVLRLLTLTLALNTLGLVINALTLNLRGPSPIIQFAIICGALVLFIVLLWAFAPPIARFVTRNQESFIHCGGLKLVDLYSFAFLMTGLYFAVDSLGPTLTWLHYNMQVRGYAASSSSNLQLQSYYSLFRYLSKLIIGTVLVFSGRKFAMRLIRYQEKSAKPLFPQS
jgi:hypothetical protein